MKKFVLRLSGLVGTAAFAAFFAFTFYLPAGVESFAAGFIEREVIRQVDHRIDGFEVPAGESAAARLATALYQSNEGEIARLKGELKANAHEQMASVLAQIRDLDCTCRDKYAQQFEAGFKIDIALLQSANARIVDFIQMTYMDVASELKRDIRVFTATNAAMFLLLLLASFLKPAAIAQMFVPGVLLAIATSISAYFYVFEQDWLLTIITGDYLGYTYLAYLGVVFLALCDIVLNRARVTTRIANLALEAIGSAATLSPC